MSTAGSMETWTAHSLVLTLLQSNALGLAVSRSMRSTAVHVLKTTEMFL